jgi:uroporphyrinogen decarboxylase
MAEMFPKEDLIATMRCQQGALLPCKLDWPIHKICYWGGDPSDLRPPTAPLWHDFWNVGWQKESSDPQMMPFPIEHPLEGDLSRLDKLTFPDPADKKFFADLQHLRFPSHRLLVGEHPFALYERAWLIAGMQNLLAAMADQPERVDELFARIGAFELGIARRYLELGVEAAWIADDYGMNSALMFSPAMWRRFVHPHLKALVDLYHGAGAIVILHSCGNIGGLIDELLAVGVDVLDPLQPNCNRLEWIRERTLGRICLCGGLQTSAVAEDGTKAFAMAQERIRQLGAMGGFIIGPDDDWEIPLASRTGILNAVEQHRNRARRART